MNKDLTEEGKLEDKLKEFFGYNAFRAYQKEIIQAILNQEDVVAILPTGAGKSLCYQLPALLQSGTAIVISPLISLMQDQVVSLFKNGIAAAFLNSSLSYHDMQQVLNHLNEYKLIYVAPERFADPLFIERLKNIDISFFVIDEAHCISQWGHSFRQEYRKLSILKETFPTKPVMALTATATQEVEKDLIVQLMMKDPVLVKGSFDRPNLTIRIHPKIQSDKQLMQFLEEHANQSGIIYASTRKGVETTYAQLVQAGFPVGRYHAGLSDQERALSQQDFLHDKVTLMVATVAFGMGIHKPDVRFIVHLDMPRTIEQYYQEIGRAGRDGLPADCLMLYGPQDLVLYKAFAEDLTDPILRQEMKKKTDSLYRLCTSVECRRKRLLKYFSESFLAGECQACDNCLDEDNKFDGSIIAQKILSCVYRVHQQVGMRIVVDVLRGSTSQVIMQKGYQELSTYGLLADRSVEELRYYIESLIQMGFLMRTEGEYPVLKWTDQTKPVIAGHQKVYFRKKLFHEKKEKAKPKPKESQVLYYHEELYEALKQLRTNCARSEQVPPYVVFSDRALQEMATFFPQDQQAFSKINGVGPIKWVKYGAQFLALVQQHAPVQESKPQQESSAPPASYQRQHSREETVRLYQLGYDIEKIMEQRSLVRSTILNHIVESIQQGVDLDLSRLVSTDKHEAIQQVIALIGAEKLTPIKERLPETVTYEEIRLVSAYYQRTRI